MLNFFVLYLAKIKNLCIIEIMEKIRDFIKENNLIKQGDVIGIGVSGGSDSMALMYYLQSLQEEFEFELVGIHINHGIREESRDEAEFVVEKCKSLGIRVYKFKIDSPKIAKERNISVETAAREGRYEIFKSLIDRGVIDKIALAHHQSDQAETILMHIFRGSGIAGARGMEPVRDGIYIRPMLTTSKKEIMDYIVNNNIDYVQDKSNEDISYNRNFLRNIILPEISKRYPNVENAIVSFGKTVTEDDEYINKSVYDDAVLYYKDMAKIPTSYFVYPNSIVNRLVIRVLKKIGIVKDFEKVHIEMIKDLAKNGENGSKIKLPYSAVAFKEYDYLTIVNKIKEEIKFEQPFKTGEMEIPNYGKIVIKRTKNIKEKANTLYVDSKKIPKTAVWRFREDGDVFTKFGGGTKKLKSYLIDKKIPVRIRKFIPVLADKKEILVIAGIEISDKVKLTENSTVYKIESFVEKY